MADRPNIIQIIWHDLGDWLGCYDRPDVESPVLDRFAAQGALLEQHFATAPSGSPSRASIMTGRHPQSHGILGLTQHGWNYRPGEQDLPELLREGGYHTALIGLQHERDEAWELTYDETFEVSEIGNSPVGTSKVSRISADDVASRTVNWLGAHRSVGAATQGRPAVDRPFYLSVGFFDVHRAYGAEFDPDVVEMLEVPGFLPDEPIVRKDMATLYERIRRADAAVGRILTALDAAGLSDNTFIFFTTDSGPELPRAKMTLYDSGIKVVFLCRWPGMIPEGRRLMRLTSHVDVLPTLLEVAGLPVPVRVEGRSFLRRLQGERGMTRDAVFAQMTWHGGEYDPMRCIRTWQYKYIRNSQPGWPVQVGGAIVQRYGEAFLIEHFARPRPAEELYDLQDDPWELRNLADDQARKAVKQELADRLGDWMATLNDPLFRGPVGAPDPTRTGSGSVWVKAPTHDPGDEEFRWAILRTQDFGEMPL